jgi:hypothetical protein
LKGASRMSFQRSNACALRHMNPAGFLAALEYEQEDPRNRGSLPKMIRPLPTVTVLDAS